MYITTEMSSKLRVFIPSEIICNNDVKQLLPAYITLFLYADQTADPMTKRTFTLKQFCQYTGTFNVVNIRHGQYSSLKDAFDWLSNAGYVTFYNLDFEKTKQPFSYHMADDVYAVSKTRGFSNGYVNTTVMEVKAVQTALLQMDRYDNFTIKALRVYYAMRVWTSYWQKDFKEKLPAWCSHFSSLYKFTGVTERTFNRVLDVLVKSKLITVLHIDPRQRRSMYIPSVIVVFNYYCNDCVMDMLRKVEKRFDSIYGTDVCSSKPETRNTATESVSEQNIVKYKSEVIGYYDDNATPDDPNAEFRPGKFSIHNNYGKDDCANDDIGFSPCDFGTKCSVDENTEKRNDSGNSGNNADDVPDEDEFEIW